MKANSNKNLLIQFSLLRGLDFISWSLVAFYCLALFTLQDIYFSNFPYFVLLPLLSLVYGSFVIPDDFLDERGWRLSITKLRCYSLICALNFPFLIFIQLAGKNTYFAICCGLVIFSIVQILLAVTEMSYSVASKFHETILASEAKLGRRLIYVFTLLTVVVMLFYMGNPGFLRELKYKGVLDAALKIMALFLVFPIIFPVTLLFRLKFALIKKHKEEINSSYE